MLFDQYGDDNATQAKIEHLQSFHKKKHGALLTVLLIALVFFVVWASIFRIDEVSRATGEVIASSRVQLIQAVDGGVLSELNVREGDIVKKGQVLARLDPTRIGSSVREVKTRLFALKAKAIRLRAEATESLELVFPEVLLQDYPGTVQVETELFKQRSISLNEDIKALETARNLAEKELRLTEKLYRDGDASGSELLRLKRSLNDAAGKLTNRRNQYLEKSRTELAKAEDEISQNEQILTGRTQQLQDSVFTSLVSGIVKNVRVTTLGGVLRAGEEIMQIIPIDDDLLIEAKVSPADIARVKKGLDTMIRFDPYDYTIYGGVKGTVKYVSADTLKEDTGRGQEIYYRVHIAPSSNPVVTTTGKKLLILPGMTTQVDIRTGDRTLLDFLLKPLRKTLADSFGER